MFMTEDIETKVPGHPFLMRKTIERQFMSQRPV